MSDKPENLDLKWRHFQLRQQGEAESSQLCTDYGKCCKTIAAFCPRPRPTFFQRGRRPDGPAGCGADFSERVHVRRLCLSSGTLPVRSDGQAAPPRRSRYNGTFSTLQNKKLNVGAWQQRLRKESSTEAGRAAAATAEPLICLRRSLGVRRGPDRTPHCRPPAAKKSSEFPH